MNKFLKSKKKNSIILILIVTIVFTACGKDKTSSSNTSANNSVSSFDSVVTSSSARTPITETSTPPEVTTAAPSVTTQTPPQTTAPKVTTKAPTTTKAPQVTTQAPPVTTTAPQKQLIVPNAAQCAVIENEIMRLVNEYRASLGIAPYGIESKLIQGARIRAKECSTTGNFGHIRPNGTSFSTVFTEVGYTSGGASAENLAATDCEVINGQIYFTCSDIELKAVARHLFELWKASPDHNKIMINTTRTKMGVGIYSYLETMTNGVTVVAFYGIQLFTLT